MKNILFLLLTLTSSFSFGQDQPSTDRFIRIVGVAEKPITNEGLKIDFSLSEIAGNEYKQIYAKSIDDVKNEFIEGLKIAAIDPSLIAEDKMKNISTSNYGKAKTEYFSLIVANEEQAKKVTGMQIDGFNIREVHYYYSQNFEDFLNEMTVEAIQDAKRKANDIAKAINKSVGDILNIDDMKNIETSQPSKSGQSSSPTNTLIYRVNVTFELK